jgi:type I restriction enzyme R subunit
MSRNEDQTRFDLITPKIIQSGWNHIEESKILVNYPITHRDGGRLTGNGRRANPLFADYILSYKNLNLAVIEAKKEGVNYTSGLEQAKSYAEKLKVPFAYATNGKKIREVNMLDGSARDVDNYPTPEELWDRIYPIQNDWRDLFSSIPMFDTWGEGKPRFYQEIAVNKVLENLAEGKKRILLTMATGTGKTNVSFQIVWKLFNSKWTTDGRKNRRPRILFLADRNILANQAYLSFLKGFETVDENALVRIKPDEIRKKGGVPKSGSVFFTIYQTFMSGPEESPYFGDYEPDFFDFIIIDECHRGGANDESNWRNVLEYFNSAVQLGLTATPKRDVNGDTYKYFGDPVYTYSLKDGINDGFLTPFRVQDFTTELDEFEIKDGDEIIQGDAKVGQVFSEADFKYAKIDVKERTIARLNLFLENFNPHEKTLIFCYTQNHAAQVRDLIDEYKIEKKISADVNYVCRVTADDGDFGEEKLKEFQDNEKTIPTILTTSKKLSTGVDARNVRNIVFLRMPDNMVEFKQIIGRGTRLYEGKDYFTIYDFVGASELFKDPLWDGEPIEPEEKPRKGGSEPKGGGGSGGGTGGGEKVEIIVQLGDSRKKSIKTTQRTSFYMADGRLISAKQFVELLFGEIPKLVANEKELRSVWGDINTRKLLLKKLYDVGFGEDQLSALQKLIGMEKSDVFDVLSYVAYEAPALTRTERAEKAITNLKTQLNSNQFEFIEFIVDKYCQQGSKELEIDKLSVLLELKYGSLPEARDQLGDMKKIKEVFEVFQKELYAA